MSFKCTRAVAKAQGLSANALNLLVRLADFADHRGRSWYSQATLSERLAVSERTIRRSLAELEASGWIDRERRARQSGRRSDVVTVNDLATAAKHVAGRLELRLFNVIEPGIDGGKGVGKSVRNRPIWPVAQPAKFAGCPIEEPIRKNR